MTSTNDCWVTADHELISKYASRHLWRFIQHNAREKTADEIVSNVTRLSKRDIRLLADIRFLLSEEVNKLLNTIAPKIVSRLSKASTKEKVADRQKIMGSIDWQKTYATRAASGGDVSLYVFVKKTQLFDLPENRLFLHMLQYIYNSAKNITPYDFDSITWYANSTDGDKWINRITLIVARAARFIRTPYIARIGKMHELSEKIIEQTKHARASFYRELAEIAEGLLICKNNPVEYLHNVLKGDILEPLNRDTLYEIAVLFKVIEKAKSSGWKESRAGLIGSSSKIICTFKYRDCILRVYYQRLPKIFAENSKYGSIMNEYNLSDKLRRPDIILIIEKGGHATYCIIEVKRSANRGYLVDGTYKLLGYLKDFEGLCSENASLVGFLVGWKGITIKHDSQKEVQLFTWVNIDDGLEGLFKGTSDKVSCKLPFDLVK